MANVTSAIDKLIDNNDNDSARCETFFRQLTPEMIRLYGKKSVSHIAQFFFSLVAVEIKLLHRDLSVSRPCANSCLC